MNSNAVIYAWLAYCIIMSSTLWILSQKSVYFVRYFNRNWHLPICLSLSALLVFLTFPYLYGVFGEPSVLTCVLVILFACNRVLNRPVFINRRALWWLLTCSMVVVLSALGVGSVVGMDFYHHYADGGSVSWHYAFFALVFVVAFYLDKRTLISAWLCLLGAVFSVMNSHFILDYIADIWLFMLFWGMLMANVKRVLQKWLQSAKVA